MTEATLSDSSTPKVVVALYNYKAIKTGDLPLEMHQPYEVIDDSHQQWWKVKDLNGNVGNIPMNYVVEKGSVCDWYVHDMLKQKVYSLLEQVDEEGCFIVRNSSIKGLYYILSLYTKTPMPNLRQYVKNFKICTNSTEELYLTNNRRFSSLTDLIDYHKENTNGLPCQLTTSPINRLATKLSHNVFVKDVISKTVETVNTQLIDREELSHSRDRLESSEISITIDSRTDFSGVSPKRYTTECLLTPKIVPYWYNENILLFINSTKKIYEERAYFKEKMFPLKWSEKMWTEVSHQERPKYVASVDVPVSDVYIPLGEVAA